MRQPRRGDSGEKRHDVDLPVATGLLQNAAHMRADCVSGSAAIGGNVFHGFSGGEIACDACLGRRQIKQGLHQFDRRRLRQGHSGQHEHSSAADEDVTRRLANGNDMHNHHRVSIDVANREGTYARIAIQIDCRDRIPQ